MRAKLYDFDDKKKQILVTKIIDSEEKKPAIEYKFLGSDDFELTMTATYSTKEKRDKRFEEISKSEMERLAKRMCFLSIPEPK